jgi:argininosuccinate lyase
VVKQETIISKADTEEIIEVVNDALTEDELKEFILSETKKEIHRLAEEVLKQRLSDMKENTKIPEVQV